MKMWINRLKAAYTRGREQRAEDANAGRGRNLIRRAADQGFTLIELLVVITILGILAAIVVFSVSGIGDKGQLSACKTDTSTIRTAQEANFAVKNAYAPDIATLISNGFLSNTSALHSTGISGSTYTISTLANAPCGPAGAVVVNPTVVDNSTAF